MPEQNLTEILLSRGESEKVEFKAAAEPLSSIGRTICAFLNTRGGVLFVGVDDNGRPNGRVNLGEVDSLLKFLREKIVPTVVLSVTLDTVSSGSVISVDVPSGPDRPYVFAGKAYVRVGTQNRTADTEVLRVFVDEYAQSVTRWERRPSSSLTINALKVSLLEETIRRAQDSRGYVFDDSKNLSSVLGQLALRQSGQLTNAADVLFGAKVWLRHPQTRLRAAVYSTDRADGFIDEQVFEGPAFDLLERADAFMRRHVSIGANFPQGQLSRDSKPQYPFNALREGLVNAIVHRDYAAFSGSVSVSIYPDRIEIWNSGRLPNSLSPADLKKPSHDSILVNPDISHVFYLHELMERVGRGTYKIFQDCRNMGLRAPEWKNLGSGVRLTLFSDTIVGISVSELNERQKRLVDNLQAGEDIQIQDFVEKFATGVSERQARRDLVKLESLGLLVRRGAGPNTSYVRTELKVQ